MKKLLSILLALSMMTGLLILPASAQPAAEASLLQVYGSNMLFACNKPIKLAGSAIPGAVITATVLRGNMVVREGQTTALADGSFEVAMAGIEGGYTEYDVHVYAQGELFADLTGVVFGALWLASGQSNMQYGLAQTPEGFALSKAGGTEEYIRALEVPAYPEYNGSGDNLPYEALNDIKGASWCKGTETSRIIGISAVAYFFACELRRELNMPVGILNSSLGGSSIYTWLSRQDIDSTPSVKDYLVSAGRYITAEQWPAVTHSPYLDMTANYNKKINPLRHFEPDGMIWYQGESDITAPYGAYTDAMNLLQKSYSKLFGYEESSMPFVFTQIASYKYGDSLSDFNLVGDFNIQLSEIQKQKPAVRAMTTIYDVSLNWDTKLIDKDMGAVGAIHPFTKKPVGEKMAFAALGLVYGKRVSYSAPVIDTATVDGSSIYVKLKNVGDGLSAKPIAGSASAGAPLYGFSVAGQNGVYVEANAEITAPDTVRVWSDSVAAPAGAAYAYSQVNNYSNLFATENGQYTLGASAFITQKLTNAKYVQDKYWSTCDFSQIWRETDEPYFASAFRADTPNASVSFSQDEKYSGTAALKVDYSILKDAKNSFAFGPALTYNKNYIWPTAFPAINRDYSANDTVSFKVKNTSGRSLSLNEMRFYTSAVSWFSPCVKGTDSPAVEIPADGQWHTVTLDLTKLCLFGNTKSFMSSAGVLDKVLNIRLQFSDNSAVKGDKGTLYVDDFGFTANDSQAENYAYHNILAAFTLIFNVLTAFNHSLWR